MSGQFFRSPEDFRGSEIAVFVSQKGFPLIDLSNVLNSHLRRHKRLGAVTSNSARSSSHQTLTLLVHFESRRNGAVTGRRCTMLHA
jgi:hypothetical protein